jgi:succinoglycan biosynthesis transport protein ExoP
MLDQPAGALQALPMTRRDRWQSRAPAERHDPAALGGAAIIAILRRRKLPFLASVVLVPFLAHLAISQVTPLYTATGTLLYDASEYKPRELQSTVRADPITDAVMATQAEVLRGLPLVEQMASRLNFHENAEFNVALRPPTLPRRVIAWTRQWLARFIPGLAEAPEPSKDLTGPRLDPVRNATLEAVQAALIVTPLKSSHVLNVSFTAQDPVLAAAAVNHAMDAYVKAQLGAKYGAVARTREWLERRAKELREEVRRNEGEMAKYRVQKGLVEGMHARLDTEQISLLTEELVHSRNALAGAEGRLDAASGRTGAAAQAAIAPSVVQLRARQGQLAAQMQSMLGRLGANHPDVQSLRAQLGEADRSVAAEVAHSVAAIEADVRADRERVTTLERDLQEVQGQLDRDSQAQIPLNALQRDAEASRGLLQSVLERLQQTAQQSAIETPDAHEISLALPPERPSSPRTGPLMAAAAAFGVLFGLLLVYLFELADRSFRSGDDIRTVLGLPCFALIPRVRRSALGHMRIDEYAARKALSPLAEQLRSLRAGLSLRDDRPRIIAITAALPAEGKTTVTLALGRLAAMNGERVIVVDCDIRQSAFALLTKSNPGPGLVDCLQERVALADVIRKDDTTGMDYIAAGMGEANALGLLMSPTMARLLQTLRQDYDLVLLDAPPAQAVTDARIVAGLADATLLCVRWHHTPRDVVLHALELLEEAHANVVGAALTLVDVSIHVRSGYADAEVYLPRHGGYFRE